MLADEELFGRLKLGHSAIALAAGLQMLAQGEARALDVSLLDRPVNAPMLELNLLKVQPPLLRGLRPRTNRLARDDHRSEEIHEPFEIRIPGCRGDGPVKGEVGVDCRAPGRDGLVDLLEKLQHLSEVFVCPLFCCDADCFYLYRQSKLKHVLYIHEGPYLVRHNAKRRACGMVRHKHAGALPADHKALGTEGGHSFANDGAADLKLADQFLLRR